MIFTGLFDKKSELIESAKNVQAGMKNKIMNATDEKEFRSTYRDSLDMEKTLGSLLMTLDPKDNRYCLAESAYESQKSLTREIMEKAKEKKYMIA